MPEPLVSVIVPVRNAQGTLPRTLEALQAQTVDSGFEVIVVDDGSTDETAALAREAGPPVRVAQQAALGPAAARNLGAHLSSGRLLAFCDADVFPSAGWLDAGVRALERAEIVQGKVLPDPRATLGPFDRTIWIMFAPGLWETANLFVRRELFERLGGFVEWLRPRRGKPLAEDVWFGYRALRLGASWAFAEDALAYHVVVERDWLEYVAERMRLQYFPAMAGTMPELRRTFLHKRVFLNPRTARFDLALAGAALAVLGRSPVPLFSSMPYLRALRSHSRRAPGLGAPSMEVALADLAADLVGLIAMLCGSARYRSVVL